MRTSVLLARQEALSMDDAETAISHTRSPRISTRTAE